jgi:glucan phosphoethanolaminetransferase (alkaline phosphatase superfamily)
LAILVIVVSCALAYVAILAAWKAAPLVGLERFKDWSEVFSRLFLVCAVLLGLLAVRGTGLIIGASGPRWPAVVVLCGFAAAALDPFHGVSGELNVIRYFTAGLLVWAGGVLLFAAVRLSQWLERIAALGFGALFLLAAADELFQFHEALGETVDAGGAREAAVGAQDLITLGVAMIGVICAGVAFLVIRWMEQSDRVRLSQAVTTAARLFILACLVFMCAMLLDTFDKALESGTDDLFHAMFGTGEVVTFLTDNNFVTRAANSLEEYLELTTAGLLAAASLVFARPRPEA